jgi:phosphatidate cytidylyltransferase
MVYKNLLYRLLLSLFFILVYLIALDNKYLLFIIGTLIYVIVFYEVLKFFKKFFKIILLYLFLSYVFFVTYFFIYFEYLIFNFFVFTIILFDSFSFFTGKFIGKNYIFKIISPKKTLEGYLGGIFFTNVFLISYIFFINFEINIIKLIMLLNLTIFISIIGDLIESYFKRKNIIKDSSKYLPGHGGFFDRFDSFIASIIMLTVFSLISL